MAVRTASRETTALPEGARRPDRKISPYKWWAGVGVFFLAVQAYAFTSWIAAGEATPTPSGASPVPTFMRVAEPLLVTFGLVATVGIVYWFLVRPWRRTGRIGLDGWLLLACLSLYWLDPLLNYFTTWTTFNSSYLNFGSWGPHIPGWYSPNGQFLPEPLIIEGPVYVWAIFFPIIPANYAMRKAKERWPQMGKFGVAAVCYVFFVIFDSMLEPALMFLTGYFSYPGAIKGLTLFSGRYYQFPVYEAVFGGICYTGWACIRYFRNDRGETFADRGLTESARSPRQQSGLRFLSLVGVVNVIYLAYFVPMIVMSLYSDPWPKDILERSYYRSNMCGPGTTYACPGPALPNPRPGSARVGPDGSLIKAGTPGLDGSSE